jgi:hypothetical protein
LSAKAAGFCGTPVPMKPNETLPPFAPIVPFQDPAGLLAVTLLPFWAYSAFHPLLMRSPARKFHASVYPEIAVPEELVILITVWNPVFHCVTIW